MIISLQLRYIKTYSGINYVPLSNSESFCGLIGINGIGKSSILEALDCYFNKKEWNFNIAIKKSGYSTTNPSIIPLFILPKEKISSQNRDLAIRISNAVWNSTETDILPRNRRHFEIFLRQRTKLEEIYSKEDLLLLPIGENYEKIVNLGIFDTKKIGKLIFPDEGIEDNLNLIGNEIMKKLEGLKSEIKNLYDYIYIPKDISPSDFTKLETVEIQSLMGESLNQILQRIVPGTKVREINQGLNSFLDQLSDKLSLYSFRTPTDRQQNLRVADVYSMIITAFFNIRRLHKKQGDQWLELRQLSSGEQQKAIIDVASNLVSNYRRNTENLIISIDEPEASLHMSACFDQFEALYDMSKSCTQLMFATHWYGFIPTTEKGNITIITKSDSTHKFDLIDLYAYREKVKQQIRKTRGQLPYDVRIKGLNDFIQSIATSIIRENPYNWLICEGSSEKIYFEEYLSEEIENKNLRIIPVGGAGEIKKIFNRLLITFDEFRSEISGKIFLLSDTDAQLVRYNSDNNFANLQCKRIVNSGQEEKTILVNIESNPVSPATEIEDSLNGKLFLETLQSFNETYQDELSFLNDYNLRSIDKTKESYFILDLNRSKQELLTSFFDKDDNKMNFARKYVELLKNGECQIPNWMRVSKKVCH